MKLADLLHLSAQETRQNASEALKRAVVEIRLTKAVPESSARSGRLPHVRGGGEAIAPGRTEFEVMAAMHDAAMSRRMYPFRPS